MESYERARIDSYFSRITNRFPITEPVSSFVVTHLLPERPSFLMAVARVSTVRGVLPKPKSVHQPTFAAIRPVYPTHELSRALFDDADCALAYFEEHAAGETVVLLDVGGYFAPCLADLCARFSGHIAGVVEDTENGHRRYEDVGKLP
jgi:adenosylhomocysteinase